MKQIIRRFAGIMLVAVLCFVSLAASAEAAVHQVSDASQLKSVIESAASGDIVEITADELTITEQILISNDITIQGAEGKRTELIDKGLDPTFVIPEGRSLCMKNLDLLMKKGKKNSNPMIGFWFHGDLHPSSSLRLENLKVRYGVKDNKYGKFLEVDSTYLGNEANYLEILSCDILPYQEEGYDAPLFLDLYQTKLVIKNSKIKSGSRCIESGVSDILIKDSYMEFCENNMLRPYHDNSVFVLYKSEGSSDGAKLTIDNSKILYTSERINYPLFFLDSSPAQNVLNITGPDTMIKISGYGVFMNKKLAGNSFDESDPEHNTLNITGGKFYGSAFWDEGNPGPDEKCPRYVIKKEMIKDPFFLTAATHDNEGDFIQVVEKPSDLTLDSGSLIMSDEGKAVRTLTLKNESNTDTCYDQYGDFLSITCPDFINVTADKVYEKGLFKGKYNINIEPLKAGTGDVTISLNGTEKKGSFKVTVDPDLKFTEPAENEISSSDIKVYVGEESKVKVKIAGEGIFKESYDYFAITEEDPDIDISVAKLSASEREITVKGLNKGTAEISVQLNDLDGKEKDNDPINVTVAYREPTGLKMNAEAVSLRPGESTERKAEMTPANQVFDPETTEIEYSSSKEEVATVDANGKITAAAEGDAVITATLKSNGAVVKTTELNVNVKADAKPEQDNGGSEKPETPAASNGSNSGCNAGFGVLALLALLPWLKRDRN